MKKALFLLYGFGVTSLGLGMSVLAADGPTAADPARDLPKPESLSADREFLNQIDKFKKSFINSECSIVINIQSIEQELIVTRRKVLRAVKEGEVYRLTALMAKLSRDLHGLRATHETQLKEFVGSHLNFLNKAAEVRENGQMSAEGFIRVMRALQLLSDIQARFPRACDKK